MAVNRIEAARIEEHVTVSETRISKMSRNDRGIIVFWIIFMWIILASVYMQVSALADKPEIRIVALVVGILVGTFNTAALIAVLGHLKHKKNQLYAEDIYHLEKMQGVGAKKWDFWKIFDVLFILVLCYLSLLMPILLRGKVLVGGGGGGGGGMQYTFTWFSLILCVLAAGGFGYFLLSHSEKELKVLVEKVYGKKGEGQ